MRSIERPGPAQAIELGVPYENVTNRIPGQHVELDERFLGRLSRACSEVATDRKSCVEAGRDWWPIGLRWATEGMVPATSAAVARPSDPFQVAGVLALCNEAGVPVTTVGGRSGVCGGSVPIFGGVSLDMSSMVGLEDVDDTSLLIDVRSGTYGDDLEEALRGEFDLTLGHWPQSINLSTVGGWIACRSAGQYSTRYGKIEDMVAGLRVVLADGRLVNTGGRAPRAAVGPDLNQLFTGSEGTLGVVTGATLRVRPTPTAERRGAWGFARFTEGLEACRRTLRRGATPAVLRLYDLAESARNFGTEGVCVLIVLDEGDPSLVDASMQSVSLECMGARRVDDSLVGRWLEHRNDVSALGSLTRSGIVVDTVEVAGRWAALPSLYEAVLERVGAVPGTIVVSAHQSHAYTDGACLYFTFAGRGTDPGDLPWAEAYYTSAWQAVMSPTIEHGCTISHHHGIGLNRSRHVEASLGEGFGVLSALKRALDPRGILNPGKLGLPSPYGRPPWP